MGLFDKLKKKTLLEPVLDERKLEQVAEYSSRERQMLRNLQVKPLGKNGSYIEGKVYCKLWDTEIDADVYDDLPLDYVEKCVEAMNSMSEELIDAICRAAKNYCIVFLDEVGGAELNGITLTIPVDKNTPPKEILKCFEIGALTVDAPKDPSRIGYQLSGNCDWEEEHGIEIDILDDKLVYLGEFAGGSPWVDHSEET